MKLAVPALVVVGTVVLLLAFVRDDGKGRVFYSTLGHPREL